MFIIQFKKMDKEQLLDLDWRDIKEYAESVGYEKPDNLSWKDEAVIDAVVALASMVVDKEKEKNLVPSSSEVASDPELIASSSAKEEKEKYVVKGTYATETFKRRGIPYCDKCGASYCNDLKGFPACPENFPSGVCPRLPIEEPKEEQQTAQEDFMDF